MSIIAAIALALSSPSATEIAPLTCPSVPGWEEFLSQDKGQLVVIGEIHGTNEMPGTFGDLTCLAAQSRDVVVAVEHPERDQPAIDRFMASDGGPDARRALLATGPWAAAFKDGRQSEAYFRLFDRLREMKAGGKIRAVVAFQPTQFPTPPSKQQYEQAMADNIIAAWRPGVTVMVFVGNAHARLTRLPFGEGYMPMASLLPAKATRTFDLVPEGGSAWNCSGRPMVCGASPPRVPSTRHMPGIEMLTGPDSPYSGVIFMGVPATASFPQKP